jgi:hypothetical protein
MSRRPFRRWIRRLRHGFISRPWLTAAVACAPHKYPSRANPTQAIPKHGLLLPIWSQGSSCRSHLETRNCFDDKFLRNSINASAIRSQPPTYKPRLRRQYTTFKISFVILIVFSEACHSCIRALPLPASLQRPTRATQTQLHRLVTGRHRQVFSNVATCQQLRSIEPFNE